MSDHCPALMESGQRRVQCLGLLPETQWVLTFTSSRQRQRWQEDFCSGYPSACPLRQIQMLRAGTAHICTDNRGVICADGQECSSCVWHRR